MSPDCLPYLAGDGGVEDKLVDRTQGEARAVHGQGAAAHGGLSERTHRGEQLEEGAPLAAPCGCQDDQDGGDAGADRRHLIAADDRRCDGFR